MSYAPAVSAEHLIEASPDAILVVDRLGRIVLANRRAETLFGFAGRLVGHAVEELIPDSLLLAPNADVLHVGGRRLDGTAMRLELRLAAMQGAAVGLIHVTVSEPVDDDDTSYERLFNEVPDAILVADDEGVIRFVNRRAEALFGYSHDELVGQPLNVLTPERSSGVEDFSGLPEDANLELVASRSDGSQIETDVSLSSIATEDGDFVLASVHDVSARKRWESERDAVDAVALAGERSVERADFEMQLQQSHRLESIGRLAGGIAHDFNNLLGVIMMYASFVSDGLGAGAVAGDVTFTSEDVHAMESDLQAVKDVAGRAAALTHKLLTFGRRDVVAPEVLDVNELVRSMEDLLSRTMGENVDDLRTLLADHPLLVKANRGQLDQVIMNLAVNARDAMLGGGTLTVMTSVVTLAEPRGARRDLKAGRYARLAVSDTGAGMSREVATRAFDPFFTTKGSACGSGFGLATVYGIVTQAGGEVTIASTLGLGTTVTVLLPLTGEPRSVSRNVAESPKQVDGHETVLLVDDERMLQLPAVRILVAHGYHVLAASNAGDALVLARNHPGEIHLLVTDIVMPGPSGQELARDIVQARPAIRVLFMSGYGWDAFDRDGPSGRSHLLDKPFAASELLRSVRVALDEQ